MTDTLRVRDTLFMGLDIEVRTYQDDDYRAVVAGIRPGIFVPISRKYFANDIFFYIFVRRNAKQ